jgi:hypothetical protein
MTISVSGSTVTFSDSSSQTTAFTGSATNLAGGAAGEIPFQTGSGTTSFTSAGSSGQVLTSAGTGTPTWTTPSAGAMTLIQTIVPTVTTTFNFTSIGSYSAYVLIGNNIQLAFGDLVILQVGTGGGPTYTTSGYYYSSSTGSSSTTSGGLRLGTISNSVNNFYCQIFVASSLITSQAQSYNLGGMTESVFGSGYPTTLVPTAFQITTNSSTNFAAQGKLSLYGISS